MSTVGGTIVVEFGDGADQSAFYVFEMDETLNLDAEGNEQSQFSPGDEVWFWGQHAASLRIDRIEATSGMVVDCGIVRRSRTQQLTFTGADVLELSHIPAFNPAYTWFGNIGGGISRNGRSVSVASNIPCTCDAAIPIDVHLYRFVPPQLALEDEETYRVVIVAYMEAA
ncbi:MAG: hypothetical protein AB7U29_10635 [Desulfobulbus sp.]